MLPVLRHHKTNNIQPIHLKNDGYTMIELVVVAAIIMFAGVFFLRISGSITGRGQYTTTDNRMMIIEAKIRQYYLAHEQLPPAAGAGNNEVPVDIDALDLEQKYRLDGWGRMFEYSTSDTNPGSLTGLQDVNDSGGTPRFAASITSGGPDQNITTIADNITKYIDLSVEAGQIVRKKLKVLMEKVAAYDALFAGVDNDGVYQEIVDENIQPTDLTPIPAIDEDPLDPANIGNTGCPPVAGFTNDPASGLPTLDAIEIGLNTINGNVYDCTTGPPDSQLAYYLAIYYHLPTHSTANPDLLPGGYDIDPWGNYFQWGYLGRILDDGTTGITPMDPHYHTFFSSGPDTTIVEDDIMYSGE